VDIVEFEDLLDRLGDDFSRWPPEQRRLAAALVEDSAEAQALLREAAEMRAFLAAPVPRAPAGLADRIVAQAVFIDPPPAKTEPAQAAPPAEHPMLAVRRRLAQLLPNRPTLRAALLSVIFLVGLLAGIFHGITRLDVDEVDLHDFIASHFGLDFSI
jgi:hypothetical protein